MSWKLLEGGVAAVTCHWRDFPTVQQELSGLNRCDSLSRTGGGLLHSQDLSDFTDHIAKQNACQPFLNEQNAASWRSAATCTDCCNACPVQLPRIQSAAVKWH